MQRRLWLALRALSAILITFFGLACSGTNPNAVLSGTILSGNTPMNDAEVSLFATGAGQGPALLATATSNSNGVFVINYTAPANANSVLYLTADLSSDTPVVFATVLGASPTITNIVINERTTVATAYAMAQFFNGDSIEGSSPGLQNAAATLQNLVGLDTGDVGAVLGTSPNGSETSTMATFNSLANLLAACTQDGANCGTLFTLATPPGGTAPDDTLEAAINIAHFPGQNVADLLSLSQTQGTYTPALDAGATLTAWTIAIRYVGNGQEMDGPGNTAFDADGNAWIANNYIYQADEFDPTGRVCGDDHVLALTPTGEDLPGAPFQGGGLYGVGFGITFDPSGFLWLGNFGFQGSNCTNDKLELSQSVSKFASDGTPISPTSQGSGSGQDHGGYPGAGNTIRQPQGTVSDLSGNIWMANCGGNSVTQFPGGNPDAAFAISPTDLSSNPLLVNPFDIAIDSNGLAWVTSNDNSSVFAFDAAGNIVHALTGTQAADAGILRPMGIASDSLGNVWVSNSGIIHLPCEGSTGTLEEAVNESNQPGFTGENASVTMIMPNGSAANNSPFKGGGIILPWGIAVDGNDNIWVANFTGQRVSNLCGAQAANCPAGLQTGDPISPPEGYSSDGLVRNTGVSIDPSGNVWLTNNWQMVPIQQNPGGHEMVVFIGLAKPVATPLIGPPSAE